MKRLMVALLACFLVVGPLTGCFKHTYTTDAEVSGSADYNKWQHHLIYGLVNLSGDIKLNQVCPNGVAKINQKTTFVNGLVRQITGAIYGPTTVRIWCASGSAAQDVDQNAEQAKLEELVDTHGQLQAIVAKSAPTAQ